MHIHYRIVEVWPNDHLIVVRYWSDSVPEAMLGSSPQKNEDGTWVRCRTDVSITLPVPAPRGEELEELILRNAPRHWLKTLEDVMNPNVDTSLSHIIEMQGKSFRKRISVDEEGPTVLTDDEIRKLIEKFSTDNTNEK